VALYLVDLQLVVSVDLVVVQEVREEELQTVDMLDEVVEPVAWVVAHLDRGTVLAAPALASSRVVEVT